MSLLRRWIVANAWSEAVGLGAAGALLGVAIGADAPPPAVIAAGVAAGLGEGLVVGVAQGRIISSALQGVSLRAWVAMTVLGGVVAWVAGSLPPVLLSGAEQTAADGQGDISLWIQLLLAVPLGLVTGPILGGWQALALRGVVERPWRWVWANAVAWAVGMPIIFVGAAGLAGLVGGWVLVVVAVLTALVAGAAVGAVHGRWLLRFAAESTGSTGSTGSAGSAGSAGSPSARVGSVTRPAT